MLFSVKCILFLSVCNCLIGLFVNMKWIYVLLWVMFYLVMVVVYMLWCSNCFDICDLVRLKFDMCSSID